MTWEMLTASGCLWVSLEAQVLPNLSNFTADMITDLRSAFPPFIWARILCECIFLLNKFNKCSISLISTIILYHVSLKTATVTQLGSENICRYAKINLQWPSATADPFIYMSLKNRCSRVPGFSGTYRSFYILQIIYALWIQQHITWN